METTRREFVRRMARASGAGVVVATIGPARAGRAPAGALSGQDAMVARAFASSAGKLFAPRFREMAERAGGDVGYELRALALTLEKWAEELERLTGS